MAEHGKTLSKPKPGKSFTSLEPSGMLSLLSGSQRQRPPCYCQKVGLNQCIHICVFSVCVCACCCADINRYLHVHGMVINPFSYSCGLPDAIHCFIIFFHPWSIVNSSSFDLNNSMYSPLHSFAFSFIRDCCDYYSQWALIALLGRMVSFHKPEVGFDIFGIGIQIHHQ